MTSEPIPQPLAERQPLAQRRLPALAALARLDEAIGPRKRRVFRARRAVQAGFALITLGIGALFARFVAAAEAGAVPLPARPPGVEAFLPISGLMGILDWIRTGALNAIHPAATVLLLIFVAMAFLLRKSFCSWVCPVGFLSDLLAGLGRKLFGRTFRPWRFFDILLRSLKYLLLAFFVHAIFTMPQAALAAFLASPYNRVADVKMYLFFVELGTVGLTVIGLLVVGSVLVHGFWCRYLCPYGALLGFFSWISPARVRRNADLCTECGLCDKVCAARLNVSRATTVTNPECTGCLDCVATCPAKGALSFTWGDTLLRPRAVALALVLCFALGYGGARVAGAWDNAITDAEYIHRLQEINGPAYGHPGR